MKKYFEIILFCVVLGLVCCEKVMDLNSDKPYVVLVSFDGFRHDYVEKYNAPNFKELVANGVSSKGLIPSYPSKTFPNHYTIVTGLYPGNHGLVDNSFYAPDLDLQYSIGNRERVENPAFYGGTPLWQLVQENGMKSASYFWVGSEAPIKGSLPDYYTKYDGSVTNEKRIEVVKDWLKLPAEQRPQFISLYFSLVDDNGHGFGPNSEETKNTVLEADRLLGLLRAEIAEIDLDVNLVVVSDHGMNEIKPEAGNYTTYDELLEGLDQDKFRFISNGAHAHFYVHNREDIDPLEEALRAKAKNYKVYKKPDFPAHWHNATNNRVGNIIITMEPGHYLTSASRAERTIKDQNTRGEHGFDPYETEDMRGIFYAEGPQVKKGMQIDAFENIHIYPFIAEILGITNLPEIDGKKEVLSSMLKK
ncbi:alkaline phosphatase family protein [Roseivirga pacifica]|nr:ectonucleotide pyrophosphatase/phosphodiesterase [Roseivirga pacifica]